MMTDQEIQTLQAQLGITDADSRQSIFSAPVSTVDRRMSQYLDTERQEEMPLEEPGIFEQAGGTLKGAVKGAWDIGSGAIKTELGTLGTLGATLLGDEESAREAAQFGLEGKKQLMEPMGKLGELAQETLRPMFKATLGLTAKTLARGLDRKTEMANKILESAGLPPEEKPQYEKFIISKLDESPLLKFFLGPKSKVPNDIIDTVGSVLQTILTVAGGGAATKVMAAPTILRKLADIFMKGTFYATSFGALSGIEGPPEGRAKRMLKGAEIGGLVGGPLALGIGAPLLPFTKGKTPISSKQFSRMEEAGNIYREILRPTKEEMKNIEIRKGQNIDETYQNMAREDVKITKDVNNKLDTVKAIEDLQEKIEPINDELAAILASRPDKTFDLLKTGEQAKTEIRATKNLTALEKAKRIKDVDEYIDSEIAQRYPEWTPESGIEPLVSGSELNSIKSGLWKEGYNMLKPTAQRTARQLGHIIKEMIEKAYSDADIRILNARLGQYAQMIDLLTNAHGRVIRSGALGKYFAGTTGAIIGTTMKIPVIGPILGKIAGEKILEFLTDPSRLTGKAAKLAKQYVEAAKKMEMAKNPTLDSKMAKQTIKENLQIDPENYSQNIKNFLEDKVKPPGPKGKGAIPKTTTLDELYQKAPHAKIEIDNLADNIAKEVDVITVAKVPLKTRASATLKLKNRLQGDISKLNDIARNTIVLKDVRDFPKTMELLKKYGGEGYLVLPNKDPLGYSGINFKVQTKAGIKAEIQANTPEMIYAKEKAATARMILGDDLYGMLNARFKGQGGKGHELYDMYNRAFDRENFATAEKIAKKSKAYYAQFQ